MAGQAIPESTHQIESGNILGAKLKFRYEC